MPSDVAPLCPSCLERVPSWTAASCPACRKAAPVAACDHCMKSRAGAFLPPAGGKGASDEEERFVCVDCMEKLLDQDVNDRMRDAILAVLLTVAVVFFTAAHVAFVYVLFVASAACLLFWGLAVRHRHAPARHARSVWSSFRRRVDAAIRRRRKALAA